MTIFVKQNSTLPEVKFELTQRLREKYDITIDMLENVAVTFSMVDAETGVYKVANAEARVDILKDVYERLDNSVYTLVYRFKLKDTSKTGRFYGEFKLDFLGDHCGKITLPNDDQITIIIDSSITKTTVI